jgi:hypothetical protein
MYFIYLHENRTRKPAEIVFSRGREMRENDGGVEFNPGTL